MTFTFDKISCVGDFKHHILSQPIGGEVLPVVVVVELVEAVEATLDMVVSIGLATGTISAISDMVLQKLSHRQEVVVFRARNITFPLVYHGLMSCLPNL